MAIRIQAAPLMHDNYFMRSQLEARWARFFSELGYDYRYEYKSFSTSYGQYLPDFYLPAPNLYIEIKPESPSEIELGKLSSVAEQYQYSCVLIAGFPVQDSRLPTDNDVSNHWSGAEIWIAKPNGRIFSIGVQDAIDAIDSRAYRMKISISLMKATAADIKNRYVHARHLRLFNDTPESLSESYKYNQQVNQEREE